MDTDTTLRARADDGGFNVGGFSIDILVQGFPGKTVCHGGLGWSTVALVRGRDRVILIDAGNFGMRRLITERLAAHGLRPNDVTDVVLTHAHYDHSINWPMFASARVLIGKQELDWAVAQPLGHHTIPEFYVRELAVSKQLRGVAIAEEVIPGLTAYAGPGHTPGHLVYVLNGGERDVIFSGDAAKNRAEMLSLTADMTMNAGDSRRTMERIWDLWRKKPGSILVPGHDVPMRLDNDEPVYIAKRTAGINAWFGRGLERTTLIELKV
jgi:glyoxylase-like metal-dependent hydrolase (beta-lactamase superfamily II)